MVLRGSEIAPENSLQQSLQQFRSSRSKAQLTEQELQELHKSSLEQLTKKLEDAPEVLHGSPEIVALAKELKERIAVMEAEKKKLWWDVGVQSDVIIRTLKQLACGGIAGAVARTTVAPLDRVKILIQTATVSGNSEKFKTMGGTARYIMQTEGLTGLWRGNLTNCVRVVPHTAVQFVSYDKLKPLFVDEKGGMSIPHRLMAGAASGMVAASVTHPMDVVRINLQTMPELGGATSVAKYIYKTRGVIGFYKGYTPAMLSLSPFIAVNFASFDTMKSWYFGDKKMSKKELQNRNPFVILGMGALAGIIAQTACYPLDTVRRRMQMLNTKYTSTVNAFYTIARDEGFKGFYKGMIPNALKVVPNNAIRFVVYEVLKSYLVEEGETIKLEGGGGG